MSSTIRATGTAHASASVTPAQEVTITTQRAAARIAGVSATTIGGWLRRGLLGPKPWTAREILKARSLAPSRGILSPHGTTSRWRVGCDCPRCTHAHAEEARHLRQLGNPACWDLIEKSLLDALANGTPYRQALDDAGVTAQAFSQKRRRDPAFGRAANAALMAGRNPNLHHGRDSAWKAGCRCPDCTDYHDRTRKPKT